VNDFQPGQRVRIVSPIPDNSDRLREWLTGRIGTYVGPDPASGNPVVKPDDDYPEGFNLTVQVRHQGIVVAAIEATRSTPKPGDRVRITEALPMAQQRYRDFVVGKEGEFMRPNTGGLGLVIQLDEDLPPMFRSAYGDRGAVVHAVEVITSTGYQAGDRVRVLAVSPDASARYRTWAVGRHATYVRPSTHHTGGHMVRFEEPNPSGSTSPQWALKIEHTTARPEVTREVAEAEQAAHERRVDTFLDLLAEQAEKEEWCERYEAIVGEVGLTARRCKQEPEARDVDVEVTFTYSARLDAIVDMIEGITTPGDDEDITFGFVREFTIPEVPGGEDVDNDRVEAVLRREGHTGYDSYEFEVTNDPSAED